MKVIVCLDDNAGILFNKRRVSRDAAVYEDIMGQLGDGNICMAPYSAKLFAAYPESRLCIDENFLEKAAKEDICFLEADIPAEVFGEIQEMVIYRWNREYPSDIKLSCLKEVEAWELMQRAEFPGKSHKIITKEVYRR